MDIDKAEEIMKESRTLEFKESVTNAFLKTVSAYANYGTGEIRFGVTDTGKEKGIEKPYDTCLDIENRINDSIDPVPKFTLSVNRKTSVITLTVYEGLYKPYLYHAKAYRRSGTATVPADRLSLTRLILEGQNLTYEQLPSERQDLEFSILNQKLSEILHLDIFSKDTMKTLELFTDENGYNKAAELLADTNSLTGIDAVRFGDSINVILDRKAFVNESILRQYDDVFAMYKQYYQYEQIRGSRRETVSLIPQEAFREAIANAIVHWIWDVDTFTHVAMYPERIEIISPGGLPPGITEEEYLRGGISVLRNRIISGIFLRLNLIERFGTGIRRINDAYDGCDRKPVFEITDNTIRIILPLISLKNNLSKDENTVYQLVRGRTVSSSFITAEAGFGKNKTVEILKKLSAEGYIRTTGNGRGTRYTAD